jgi:hypothetical protein
VQLIRSHRPDGNTSYLLYIKAANAPAVPLGAVIFNDPYSRIDWTGEAVDLNAPGEARSTAVAANSDAMPFLYLGLSVVIAYGRFYTNGSVEDDIRDAQAPYMFIASKPAEFDLNRVASIGGSWGGLMALYGASRAPSTISPATVVAISPPSDLFTLYQYAETFPASYQDPPSLNAFYAPYLERIRASTGGTPAQTPAGFLPYRHPTLCAGLKGPAYVLHDEADVIVPVSQSQGLTTTCPAKVTPVWWARPCGVSGWTCPGGTLDLSHQPIGHGPFASELSNRAKIS